MDFSIPRYMYYTNEVKEDTCPHCHANLAKQYASYLVFVRGEEDALMMGNKDGYFCPACPVVVLDAKILAKTIGLAMGGSSLAFHVAGIVDIDALPEGTSAFGDDGNPIPLVEFLNHSTASGARKELTEKPGVADSELNEKELLETAVALETDNATEQAIDVLNTLLKKNPASYHALFLKARNLRKKGQKDESLIKRALVEAIRQNASKGVFEVMEEEIRLQYSFDKNRYVMQELLGEFIGKKHTCLEKAFGYTYYLELHGDRPSGTLQEHALVVEAFFAFVNGNPKVIKTDNGIIQEITELSSEAMKKNLLLLGKNEGLFYDDVLEISYAFLGENFFAYVLESMLMFSTQKDDVERMAGILDSLGISHCTPYELPEESLE